MKDYLPDGVILAEEDFQGRVGVSVAVEQITERRITLPVSGIQIINMPEGFKGEIAEESGTYEITLVGLARDLEAVDVGSIHATIDMASFMAVRDMETLSVGHYAAELSFSLDAKTTLKEPVTIRLNVTGIGENEIV